LIGKGKRKLGDRHKKINAIGEEVARVESEANAVINDIHQLQESPALQNENGLSEPKAQAEALRQLKDQLKPTAERAKAVQGECKALIKSAAPEADTKQLSQILQDVSKALGEVDAQIGARQLAVDAAVQQMGSYNDAQRDLQNWLEETEELVDNQKLPSADAKVARAQLQSYDVILKHIEDKQASVDGFQQMIGKLAALTSDADEKRALSAKADEITGRYEELLDGAQRGQARLRDAVDLAEKLGKELGPFEQWIGSTEKRISQLGKLPTDTERLVAQVRDVEAIQDDIDGKIEAVQKLCQAEVAMQLSDDVSQLCKERTEILGQTLAHVDEIGHSFEDMNRWLDEVERDLAGQPSVTTATPSHELAKQQQHNLELSAVIAAQTPLVERFEYNVNSLAELVGPADVQALRQIYDQIVGRYNDVKNQVKSRGEAIDSILDATEAFGDRLDVFLATLEGAAESLRQPAAVSADPGLLQNRIAENEALLDSLREKKWPPRSRPWSSCGAKSEEVPRCAARSLNDALAKAHQFWAELDDCQKAIDDLKARLETLEPAIGQPERLREQQQGLTDIDRAVRDTRPRIDSLRHAEAQLLAIIPEEEQMVVGQQVEMVEAGLGTITKLFSDKSLHLGKAMEEAMQFHDDLSALHEFLEAAEQRLHSMGPAENVAVEKIQPKLEELQLFPEEVNQKAHGLTIGRPAHQTAAVRVPIAELNGRWSKLYGDIADREHKIERAMLEMGRLGEAVAQLTAWIEKTRSTVHDIAAQPSTNLRAVEIAQCKLAVVNNDVHAHEPSINSINATANKLRAQGGDATTTKRVEEMNEKWAGLGNELSELSARLEGAKGAAEDIGGEMERWLAYVEHVESQLETTRPTGGLPETARQQLDDFLGLKREVDRNTSPLEAHVAITEEYLAEHPEDEGSWIGKSAHTLRHKWNRCRDLLSDREKKLGLALEEAIALDHQMNDTAHWVSGIEQMLAELAPVGRLPEVLEKQKAEQQQMAEQVADKKTEMTEMQATGTRMQYYCEKKDAIPIKNGLVSLRHRFEKVAQKVAERGKQLEHAQGETDSWLESAKDLEFWMAEMGIRLDEEAPGSANHQKLLEWRDEAKEAQAELTAKRPEYEAAEEAVLESGAFEDAIADLEAWCDAELLDAETDLAMDGAKVHGDVETVRGLQERDAKRGEERTVKKGQVERLLKKADELVQRGVAEGEVVLEAKHNLQDKWSAIEAAADARAEALRKAMEQAEDFDAKAHGLLAWMDGLDDRLKAAGKEPNLDKAIPAAQAVLDELKAEEARKEVVLARGQDILQKAHPNAEQPMRHWNRLLAARWKEVEDQALEKVADLKEQRQKSEEREKAIKELLTFVTKKRGELGDMIAAPTPEDLDTEDALQLVDRMLQDYELLDFELREKQPDVEETIQGGQKDKNPRASQLSDEWKRVWLDAMGHKNALDEAKEMLEEMKRLEGWDWEDWKERYCDWNDHAKGRVTDLFRRIDRTATGNVPRQAFIDAIINSRFPTSRLEMEKVADLFDNNGFINHKDFTNALRFDKTRRVEPRTDGERIAVEIERQVRGCSCCQPYKIERIAEGQYRFGDTQIKRMVRILRSTVMVRVGGGWVCLEEFLKSHDPCRATKRRNDVLNNLRGSNERIIRDSMEMFTKNRHARFGSSDSEPQFAVPGPIIKIREKTERSMPMFPGQHRPGGSAHSSNSRLRTPSDVSLGDSRIGKGWPGNSPFGSQQSLDKGSRPPSRASESGPDKPTRIPSLRGKKGVRYNPPRQL
ncbi:unnamed protein product, partial [Mesorhabditis spiculigera]